MITCFPATSHLLPLVPTAWALQSAGHEVVVATPPGYPTGVAVPDFHRTIAGTGLTAVPCGAPAPLAVHDRDDPDFAALLPDERETEDLVTALGIAGDDRTAWDVFYHFALLTIRNYLPPRPRPDIDALVDFARSWQPDLVLWEPWFPAGAVAARACGAAHARFLISPDYTAWAHERFRAAGVDSLLSRALRPLAERHGVEVDDDLLFGHWTMDPLPEGLRLPTPRSPLSVRYTPYGGPAVRAEWLGETPERPRVVLSLGASSRQLLEGDSGRLPRLLSALGGLDVDVVATVDSRQLGGDAALVPGNVRLVDYLPLGQVLPSASAMIDHGGIGTFMAGVAHGVPQLVCDSDEPARAFATVGPDGLTWRLNAHQQGYSKPTSAFVLARGAGDRLDHRTHSVDELRERIRRVVGDPAVHRGAARVQEEWRATPSPVAVVGDVEELTAAAPRRAPHSGGRSTSVRPASLVGTGGGHR